jgi:hypothetical protein
MSEMTLHEQEQGVERARAKLAADLAIIRSPSTFSIFKEDVKQEALNTKDILVERARSTAQTKLNELVGDLKAKAAANPLAALAIGAGIAWRLIAHPPIATSLIGVGLFSLWQTPAHRSRKAIEPDYFVRGKERLREQAGKLALTTSDAAADVGQLGRGARDAAAGSPEAGAEYIAAEANRATRTISGHARTATAGTFANSGKPIHGMSLDGGTVGDQQSRDSVLLGVAGAAVLAALGMAYKNRFADDGEIDLRD